MKICSVKGCEGLSYVRGFCLKHYTKFIRYKDPLAGYELTHKRGEGDNCHGRWRVMKNKKRDFIHRLIVEKVIDRPLIRKEIVHHLDGNPLNNEKSNLVLCQDEGYHRLLHQRKRALDTCGHASWRKCVYCKQYDKSMNLFIGPHNVYHRNCRNENQKKYYKLKKENNNDL